MLADHILIAGIGNLFLGDDAFGCEVVRRLLLKSWPARVRICDFGIRGFDVAYALMDGYGQSVLVDAAPRGDAPGTVYLIEPDLAAMADEPPELAPLEGHSMDPLKVLRLVRTLGGEVQKLFVVGCEPFDFGLAEEGRMGLSPVVAAAVDPAVALVERLVAEFLNAAPRPAD
ncbi:MAG TPA: hydrogenase maturation protease [Pirellulales bacterium]|jgi:hydrogenase maturation protease|nr:hydrogenase maturation protease [Pirellulales bacterium]